VDGGALDDALGSNDAVTGGRSHCREDRPGSALARVRWSDGIAFCVDTTEVTNAAYATFLSARVALGGQAARCQSFNLAFEPQGPDAGSTNGPPCPAFDPVTRGDRPVVCVNWCDADAYCRWAGKRLCGRPGGGRVTSAGTRAGSEWLLACTGDRPDRYPYGNDPIPGRCVDRRYPQATADVRPVREAALCEGGVPGAFDMSGNAWEWVDNCDEGGAADGGQGRNDSCPPQGGSYSSDVTASGCLDSAPFRRVDVAGDTGFRCCADADFF
jgi:sulfatase modifying factor 1